MGLIIRVIESPSPGKRIVLDLIYLRVYFWNLMYIFILVVLWMRRSSVVACEWELKYVALIFHWSKISSLIWANQLFLTTGNHTLILMSSGIWWFQTTRHLELFCNVVAGSARTSLVITIGPSPRHRGETLSTIMFGQRVRLWIFLKGYRS